MYPLQSVRLTLLRHQLSASEQFPNAPEKHCTLKGGVTCKLTSPRQIFLNKIAGIDGSFLLLPFDVRVIVFLMTTPSPPHHILDHWYTDANDTT